MWFAEYFDYARGASPVDRVCLLLVVTLCLSACYQSDLEGKLETYNERLTRSLGGSLPALKESQRLALPRSKLMVLEIESTQIDLLDFLRLHGCEIQQVVAEANSSLGKLGPESSRLRRDLDFIAATEACLPGLNPEFRQVISAARDAKRRDLKKRTWNAVFADQEYREFWQVNLDNYPATTDPRLELAIAGLDQIVSDILKEGQTVDWQALDKHLNILKVGEAGALLASWQFLDRYLAQADQMIKQLDRPLCYKDMRTPAADIFRNVVSRYFIADIQKDAAVLNRRYFDLMVPLRRLEAKLEDVQPEAYRQFVTERDRQLEVARAALARHVGAIEPLMAQCGFLATP